MKPLQASVAAEDLAEAERVLRACCDHTTVSALRSAMTVWNGLAETKGVETLPSVGAFAWTLSWIKTKGVKCAAHATAVLYLLEVLVSLLTDGAVPTAEAVAESKRANRTFFAFMRNKAALTTLSRGVAAPIASEVVMTQHMLDGLVYGLRFLCTYQFMERWEESKTCVERIRDPFGQDTTWMVAAQIAHERAALCVEELRQLAFPRAIWELQLYFPKGMDASPLQVIINHLVFLCLLIRAAWASECAFWCMRSDKSAEHVNAYLVDACNAVSAMKAYLPRSFKEEVYKRLLMQVKESREDHGTADTEEAAAPSENDCLRPTTFLPSVWTLFGTSAAEKKRVCEEYSKLVHEGVDAEPSFAFRRTA